MNFATQTHFKSMVYHVTTGWLPVGDSNESVPSAEDRIKSPDHLPIESSPVNVETARPAASN